MRILLVLFVWLISLNSHAIEISQHQLQMLPKLCKIRLTNKVDSPAFSTWKSRLGKESIHVHHYCYGLSDLNRYYENPGFRYKKGILTSAKSNFNYVLTRLQNPNYILLPDIYYRLGIVAKEEGKYDEAINYSNKSIQAKKNYLNPYILLADIYIYTGDKSAAKKTLLQAQQYHPNSKRLKKRLKKL